MTEFHSLFDSLMDEVEGDGGGFGHRQHVHLAWLAVRRYGLAEAERQISAGIRELTRRAGRPGKFHAPMTRAWVKLVGHHVAAEPNVADFDRFAELNPELLDKRLLDRFYSRETLWSPAARGGWMPPDRAPFPWSGAAWPHPCDSSGLPAGVRDVAHREGQGGVRVMAEDGRSPRITHISWGRMDIDGVGSGKDFKVWPGGGRPWDWSETGTRHVPGIQPGDVAELIERGCSVVVLSRGMELRLRTMQEALTLLEESGVRVHTEETTAAVALYNELAETERVGGLFHSTC